MGGRFRAVIFDMDGLVLDSEIGYARAWRQAAAEMGFTLSEAFCTSLSGCSGGMVAERLQAHCGTAFDIERFASLSSSYWSADVQRFGIAVKPGFFAALQAVLNSGLPFCLATNSALNAARRCLAHAGLTDTFACIVAGDAVAAAKPAPDIFLQAAAELACPIQDCLVLEDSPSGVAAAKAAGAVCIMVPSVKPPDAEAVARADYLLDDLRQVADFISGGRFHPL